MLIGFTLLNTFKTPAPVSSVAIDHRGLSAFLGSNDGTLRWYSFNFPGPTRVAKAVRGLGEEISSIAIPRKEGESAGRHYHGRDRSVWVGAGKHAYLFDLSVDDLVLTPAAAKRNIHLGQDDEDAVNELTFNSSATLLAFSTDNGSVGVVDVASMKIVRMRTKHNSICGSVKFVPHRPSELVSGGYDSALLHFDHVQGSILSRHMFGAPPPTEGFGTELTLSPPFVLCTAFSSTGLLAAGTADGRVWIGTGGKKNTGGGRTKKRAHKWEGLRPEAAFEQHIAEGPVVGLAFFGDEGIFTCTLLGSMAYFELLQPSEGLGEQRLALRKKWMGNSPGIAKVNALEANNSTVLVGGIGKDGKGVSELWGMTSASNDGCPEDTVLHYQ